MFNLNLISHQTALSNAFSDKEIMPIIHHAFQLSTFVPSMPFRLV